MTASGKIWELGNHRLMNGDSMNPDDVARLMDGEVADMLFTDPPYGISYQSGKRPKSDRFEVLMNDDSVLDFFPMVKEHCDGFVFVCTSFRMLDDWSSLFRSYYDLTNLIVWHKNHGGMGDLDRTFSTDYEFILCSHNGQRIRKKRIGSVWTIPTDSPDLYLHPTQKPIELPMTAIDHSTDEGGVVLDLFGGSGSTLLACEELDRRCCIMEIDPTYCDVIVRRYKEYSARKRSRTSLDMWLTSSEVGIQEGYQ